MNYTTAKADLLKNLALGVAVIAVYFWWLFSSNAYSVTREAYMMVTKDKTTVSGKFINTEKFDMDEGGGEIADGYGYKYSFITQDNRTIEDTGWNYGELPQNIEIEYISDNPNISRVKGLLQNENTLTEWFQHKVLFKLLGLIFCSFISYMFIKSGINGYK